MSEAKLHQACHGFADANPTRSARQTFSRMQKSILILLPCLWVAALVFAPVKSTSILLAALWFMAWISIFLRQGHIVWHLLMPSRPPLDSAPHDDALPIYSILVPLFEESAILPSLLDHLAALDYPPEKLDIMLLIEERDTAMRHVLQNKNLPDYIRVIIVPDAPPRTKPKACNYGLSSARGEFIVIYDAEDNPHPQQLRAAVARFRAAPENLACLQSPLDFETSNGNWLSLQSALEYYLQFHFFLPVCEKLGLPVLLGGTSNHFRIDLLRALGGWDGWNVTEDAELGVRLAVHHYQTAMLPLPTREIPCYRWRDWHRQRARWIKGWLQTYFAYMRAPQGSAPKLGWKLILALQALILCQIAAIISFPIFFAVLPFFVAGLFFSNLPVPDFLVQFNFMFGLAVAGFIILCYGLAARRRPGVFSLWLLLTSPFYWLLSFFALLRAMRQLVFQPHRWDKTPHPAYKTSKAKSAMLAFSMTIH